MNITVVLRLIWNSFSDQQYLFLNVQHALILVNMPCHLPTLLAKNSAQTT